MRFYPIRLLKSLIIVILFVVLFHLIDNCSKHSYNESISTQIDVPPLLDKFIEISYTLEPFTIALPHFPDDEARDWFFKSTYYRMYSKLCPNKSCEKNGFLFDNPDENLNVRVALVKNGLYLNDECGYNYDDEAIRRTFKWSDETSVMYETAIIYTVPDGWSFQHFLDGVGPKLSHSRFYLDKYPDAKIIIEEGIRFDPSVKEIWALLGVKDSNRLIHYDPDSNLGAHLLINPCRTPGIHPNLWHDARRLYWSLANLPASDSILSRNKLIYIQRTRANSNNPGRYIENEEPFIEILRQYAIKSSLKFFQYDHSKQKGNIVKQIQLFYRARIIIGVHGGAQSNINFAQPGTTIIEIMPYRPQESTIPIVCSLSYPDELKTCVGYIYYTQSQLLNHSYWILPTPVKRGGNLTVSLTRVKRLFDSLV